MIKSPDSTYIKEGSIVLVWHLPGRSLKVVIRSDGETYYKKVWGLNQKEKGYLKDLDFEDLKEFLK
jgi:hypothetical protein